MSAIMVSLMMVFLLYALIVGGSLIIGMLLPASSFGAHAKAVLNWVPPFLYGDALRAWATATAERLARSRLAGKRDRHTAAQLAAEVEEGAMQAMLPTAEPSELERVIACPETGQGMIGLTAPEALAIADFLRRTRSRAEQRRIYGMALENTQKIAARLRGEGETAPLPCPLQGPGHVCCAYDVRPLRCRPLHAAAIAMDLGDSGMAPGAGAEEAVENSHEATVAQGVELGVTRALKSAGLDANIYELNSALAAALGIPDAAERWAKGENVFQSSPALTPDVSEASLPP